MEAVEHDYNPERCAAEVQDNLPKLQPAQEEVWTKVTAALELPDDATDKMFFVDGRGGTGKTFLYRLLLSHVRSQGKIALAVASSGLAALLLPGGRTAHSRTLAKRGYYTLRKGVETLHERLLAELQCMVPPRWPLADLFAAG
ncbi:hypothetical protein WJX77_008631 [Trebouxia sp. C0004]